MVKPALAPLPSNNPPLIDQAKMEIDTRLAECKPRLDELNKSLEKAKCETADDAGKTTDLAKLFKKLQVKIDAIHKEVKEPYLEASSAVDGAKRNFSASISVATLKLRTMLQAFDDRLRAEEDQRRREEQQRIRDEEARQRAIDAAARAVGASAPSPPEPEVKAAPVTAPVRAAVASGDYGAAAHRTTRKVPEIVDMYALPPEVIEAPDVQEAALKVIRRLRLANPDIVIPGVKIVEQSGLQLR